MAKQRSVIRVVPKSRGGWKVTQGSQTISNHRKKATAVQVGRDLAKKKQPSQLVIHKQDGKIQTEHTYTSDPYPPEG
jgi:hypothetical protein